MSTNPQAGPFSEGIVHETDGIFNVLTDLIRRSKKLANDIDLLAERITFIHNGDDAILCDDSNPTSIWICNGEPVRVTPCDWAVSSDRHGIGNIFYAAALNTFSAYTNKKGFLGRTDTFGKALDLIKEQWKKTEL